MPNMEYCRFTNTCDNMRDCLEALGRVYESQEVLSDAEAKCAGELAEIAADYLELVASICGLDPDDEEAFSKIRKEAQDAVIGANNDSDEENKQRELQEKREQRWD